MQIGMRLRHSAFRLLNEHYSSSFAKGGGCLAYVGTYLLPLDGTSAKQLARFRQRSSLSRSTTGLEYSHVLRVVFLIYCALLQNNLNEIRSHIEIARQETST